mmetsp:Transcript_31040/g.50210  ORF Transcript_31040/g.50210 Transcript_31040/m.50210 type:complete len:186 (-) Transcript_31040:1015-1572(-)|eukprot:CAMPEP_0184648542 /NCGR_PEP_ID=MMETSP0308-20130426/5681_1 /TAXON_ID=38269 /ORGANISM="Gloeochaete witrockiana, Strain SAG 46.84" /LENGTH=185 /DNA_ID=CAMNT_0027080449 /DNA_START=176 /DNA_END=733 /DNA_ORIENTATION=-
MAEGERLELPAQITEQISSLLSSAFELGQNREGLLFELASQLREKLVQSLVALEASSFRQREADEQVSTLKRSLERAECERQAAYASRQEVDGQMTELCQAVQNLRRENEVIHSKFHDMEDTIQRLQIEKQELIRQLNAADTRERDAVYNATHALHLEISLLNNAVEIRAREIVEKRISELREPI